MNRPYKVLIIGYPRSGTQYMAKCLTRMGLDVRHEKFGRDGGSGYHFAKGAERANGRKGGTGWRPALSDVEVVVHIVRDPRRAVESAWINLRGYVENWRARADFVAGWVLWNAKCEELLRIAEGVGCVTMGFQIEAANRGLVRIASELGLEVDLKAWRKVRAVPRTTNHRSEYIERGWDRLSVDVRRFARLYGYDAPPADVW